MSFTDAHFSLFVLIAVSLYAAVTLRRHAKTLPGIPWGPAGKPGLLGRFRSALASVDMYYTLVKSSNLLSVYPAFLVFSWLDGGIVALPPRSLKWLSSLHEDSMGFLRLNMDRFQLTHTMHDLMNVHGSSLDVMKLVARVFTRRTKSMVPTLHQEMESVCREYFGHNHQEWTSICLKHAVARTVVSTTNRILVDIPLCHDQEYLRLNISYAMLVFPAAVCIRLFPEPLKSLVGRCFRIFFNWRYISPLEARLLKFTTSKIEEAKHSQRPLLATGSFAHLLVQEAAKQPGGSEALTPKTLAWTIISLNFAGVHTTSMMITAAMYNILSCDPAMGLVEKLRLEIAEELPGTSGSLTWTHVDRLKLLDAVIRETLRLNPIDAVGSQRIVEKPLRTPDDLLLQPGTLVGVSTYAIHLDESTYPKANRFNPFRFYDDSVDLVARSNGQDVQPDGESSTNTRGGTGAEASYTVTDQNIAFGHGIRTCPGRWLAVAEAKLLIAFLLTHYEFQPLAKLPPTYFFGTMPIPSLSQRVMVRNRARK